MVEGVDTVRTAAERAAALNKQLLACGRKQVLVLQVLDLNELLGDVKAMLSTLPSEQIQLMVIPGAHPLPVKVDPGKIEQVIMNLAVNACDAMPSGGVLKIRTARISRLPSEASVTSHSAPYAMVELTDTGNGMDTETKGQLFDPFLNTKPIRKGTRPA